MDPFLKTLLELKIDFSNLVIERLGGGALGTNSELTAKDFIRFAKTDIKEDSTKGLVNSLTNAKRAIDCQIDNALEEFGIDINDCAAEFLIKQLGIDKKNLPYKLKLVQALGLAPSGLTSKVRNLRNKLEHYYKIPKRNEVEEAIEIAELFILSMESKTKILDDHFIISSSNHNRIDTLKAMNEKKYDIHFPSHYNTQIIINFDSYAKKIELMPVKDDKQKRKTIYKCDNGLYFYFLRLINHLDEKSESEDDLKLILNYINHPIPNQNIKILEFY